VSALCALYDDQAVAGLNHHPHPRGKGLKALLERLRIDWAAEKRRTFEDRAIHGLNDGYTIEQAGRLCALLLRGGVEDGRQRLTGTDLYLVRTRLDFLMLHSMMLRGESTRKAELADLCSVLLPDEGSECLGLVLRTSVGKTIPLALGGNLRMQHYHAALRHRDPVLCPVGALAHWLVLRWEICGETPPDFRRRESWYTTKVLPGKLSLAQKEISDDTQRNWILPALEAVAVDSSKVIHAMRQSMARLADMWEVPADQVGVSFIFRRRRSRVKRRYRFRGRAAGNTARGRRPTWPACPVII
jgi:hypothetical protein